MLLETEIIKSMAVHGNIAIMIMVGFSIVVMGMGAVAFLGMLQHPIMMVVGYQAVTQVGHKDQGKQERYVFFKLQFTSVRA